MEDGISNRIEFLISALGMNNNSFANSLGKSASNIKQIIDGKSKPGFDMLNLIKKKHPNVNLDWLLLGEGQIFVENTDKKTVKESTPELWENLKKSYESTIEDLRYTIQLQKQILLSDKRSVNFNTDIELPPYHFEEGRIIVRFGESAFTQKNSEIQEVA